MRMAFYQFGSHAHACALHFENNIRLDMDLHSRILMNLAEVLADTRAKTVAEEVDRLLARCPPVPLTELDQVNILTTEDAPDMAVLTRQSQHSLSALVRYATKAPKERQDELLPRLLAYIRYLPAYNWEETILTKGLPPADGITYSLFSGLLDISFQQPEEYERIVGILWSYGQCIIQQLNTTTVERAITFILPSLAGLSRALQLTPYIYRPTQLLAICHLSQPLIQDTTLVFIRQAITACLREHESTTYSRRVLAKYWEDDIPLSSNRVIYDLLIILRNVSARVISKTEPISGNCALQPSKQLRKLHLTLHVEPAWSTLMKNTAGEEIIADSDSMKSSLRSIYVMSLGYYEDIRKYAEKSIQEGKKWASDAYMPEIMGTSLQVAALASVYLHEVDDVLIDHVTECLFDIPQTSDPWVHVASLDAIVLISINFPLLNGDMINTLCRFLATPSPVFDLITIQGESPTRVQQLAITRLAQCVQAGPQAQQSKTANSTFYALMNEITRYSGEAQESNQNNNLGSSSVISGAPSHEQLSEKQKQQVCENAFSAVVGIAVYLKDDAIIGQALTMLVLVLRQTTLSINSRNQLTSRLVDLALVSPISVFQEIMILLSSFNREALLVDNKQLTISICNAQRELAKGMSSRSEFYFIYLNNLLNLFIDNGNTVQRIMSKNRGAIEIPLTFRLGSLLPVLKTLLEHDDLNPHEKPSEETVALFRNLWFHCILFGFVSESMWVREWHESMLIIAKKTPVLVIESATSYLESDLECNSVLRGSNTSDQIINQTRQRLTGFLPSLAYDIKSFSFAQVVFASSVYHIEMMRSRMGNCSHILRYFMNEGVNSSPLSKCLETIADRVIGTFVKDASSKALTQTLGDELPTQVAILLERCCHRLRKVHELAIKSTERIVISFPQIFVEKKLVTLLLELVQLLWLSCEAEYREEYSPQYYFTSKKVGVTLELGDSYSYRKEICSRLYESAKKWLLIAIDRAPLETSGLLQDYMSDFDRFGSGGIFDTAHLGRSLALEIGRISSKSQLSLGFAPKISSISLDDSSNFVDGFVSKQFYSGEVSGIEYSAKTKSQFGILSEPTPTTGIKDELESVLSFLSFLANDVKHKKKVASERLNRSLKRAAGYAIAMPEVHPELLRYLVRIPVEMFTPESLDIGTSVWNWILVKRPDMEKRLMVEMLSMWSWAQRHRKGLFSPLLNSKNPFVVKMSYAPSDNAVREREHKAAMLIFSPHNSWIKFLSSRFYAIRHRNKHLVNMLVRLLQESFNDADLMSTHPLSRYTRFQLLRLGMKILRSTRMEALAEHKFRSLVYDASFQWFSFDPKWHFGARRSLALMEHKLLNDFYNAVSTDTPNLTYLVTSVPMKTSNSKVSSGLYMFLNDKTKDDVVRQHQLSKKLLMLFLESELVRLSVWCNPMNETSVGYPATIVSNTEKSMVTDDVWKDMVHFAWTISPRLAVQMDSRFVQPIVHRELHHLIANNTLDVVDIPEALVILLGERLVPGSKLDLKYLQYWAPVPAITATSYFLPTYNNHPLILQYAMRSLEYYPVDTVFFYIPQIVQALRFDDLGYVEKYIMEAGQVSQLFAHQLIWNMKANFFVDADKDCLRPDSLKPTLEKIIENLAGSFTGEDREFYEREFKFFGEVTAISGYLKEYIKFGQNEKKPLQKKRLDEEIANIVVDKGVYLPSNSDGRVIDINRKSGRPLQSHAKAPFMATFEIEKDVEVDPIANSLLSEEEQQMNKSMTIKAWQGAIFKVGDDCRQDVLALQLIAVFKNIFTSVGLDLYVYPYRVVATAPGCGVIDVIPRSISRDQLGREKVNNMYDYFVAKYGGPESIHFQKARTNFVQSVAAYSVISYLLQIKDRHNGNIMLDDDGHIIHIDFGFIFDIAPGGITFENSPFKLTTEMIQVMGGTPEQGYKKFSELVIKAYLACRPYAELIMQLVSLMLQSGLPCFKGETIKRMRGRFQLDKSERAAADFMTMCIQVSSENQRTVLYDRFQKLTNGIPF
ncbi:hypothetical protein J3Q64DRAFT_1850940 [Phycomyces blakesleeanus]|uniref:1-phosphatidylinositol 4-kinase n=1 Tax=Phycomyces blakesleeanus TaxID=4837 RepID=A0ABR3ATD8_PHYBL